MGLIFKVLPELLYNTALSDTRASEAAKTLGKQLLQAVPSGGIPIPTAVRGPLELLANYNFYSGQSVISPREERLVASQQYRPGTSEIAKLAGSLGISPIGLEHLVRSYVGNIGILTLAATDVMMRPFSGDQVSKPEKALNEIPVIGSMFQPETGRGVINAVFQDINQWAKAAYSYKQLASDPKAAKEFAAQYANQSALNSVGGGFREQMGELAAAKRQIAANPKLSSEQKKAKIDAIKQLELRLARQIREYAKKAA